MSQMSFTLLERHGSGHGHCGKFEVKYCYSPPVKGLINAAEPGTPVVIG